MAVIAASLLISGCGGGDDDVPPPTQRTTKSGTVNGLDRSATTGTYAWLGVPFAQPPVGALRWAPPVDPAPWTDVRAATQFGHSCAQGGRFFSPAPNDEPFGLNVREGFGKPVGDEDCLTLNIWRPANDQSKLPVIVFIYGGSNISGYTADPSYDGQVLAKKGNAVVVTVNYRLGLLGWFDLPQLKTGDAQADSGNFALLDQLQALKFIKNNIEAFGGDPGNVTVMGQSAGAVNVFALLTSPLSAGLMHKAVPMSGGINNASRTSAQRYSSGLLNALVIADGKATNTATAQAWVATQSNAQIAAYLRGISANQVLTVMLANPQLGNSPAPIADGNVVPANALAAVTAGQYQKIPLLVGNTKDEGTLFAGLFGAYLGTGVSGFKPNDYDRFGLQFNFNTDAPGSLTEADFINPAYLPVTALPSGWNAMSAFVGDSIFITPLPPQLNALTAQQPGQVWYYRFDWNEEPAPFNTVYGATHGLDVSFAMGNFSKSVASYAFSTANKPGREALSDAMLQSIAAFAKTGNPNHPGLGVTWPNYPAKLTFDASPTQLQITAK
jgi:para-nitrobenzyl esterase